MCLSLPKILHLRSLPNYNYDAIATQTILQKSFQMISRSVFNRTREVVFRQSNQSQRWIPDFRVTNQNARFDTLCYGCLKFQERVYCNLQINERYNGLIYDIVTKYWVYIFMSRISIPMIFLFDIIFANSVKTLDLK